MANRTDSAAAARVMNTVPSTMFGGDAAVNIDARGFAYFTQIMSTGSSAVTATFSRINSLAAAAHSTGLGNQFTLAGSSDGNNQISTIDWPYYRVSMSTQSTSAKINFCVV